MNDKNFNINISAFDPIKNHEPVTAPSDDATLKLWFDHFTEKVARYDISGKDSGRDSYTIQMAKNEIEGCHFFLYSPTARKVLVKVSDFENEAGEKLHTELGVEFYIEDGYLPYLGYPAEFVYPDAVIPYASYVAHSSATENGTFGNSADSTLEFGAHVCIGPFSTSKSDFEAHPFRDSVRGFTIEATSTGTTTPGAYKATIEITDADSGECIKMANLYAYVYDVTLSEETALDTAFGLWDVTRIYEHQYSMNPELKRYSAQEITKATADFFLKNRITLTGGASFCDTVGREWLENPRVTSIRVLSKKQYDEFKDDPILSKKMFFYGQDEPGVPRGWRPINWPDGTNETVFDNTGLLSILAVRREADMLKNNWGWNNYRLLIPYERTMDFSAFDFDSLDKTTAFPAWYDDYAVGGERDSVEYLADHVNVWTNVFTGATPKKISADVEGCLYMQTEQQNDTFGEYHDRMESFRARGDELWNYVACEPRYYSPYQNVLLFNDGTEGRTMFWTTYMLHGTGFLYWHISFYDVAGNNTYTLRSPFSKTGPGDGILVYPGAAYGQLDPIPSIRLLNMRDGVEDYELLTMLRDAKGEAFTDELVSHIVTSTVNFTRDDDHIYNARSYLLRVLEEENNK